MTDITKCLGTDCPFKERCYRFTAPSNRLRQSYFTEIPFDKEKNECKEFYDRKVKQV